MNVAKWTASQFGVSGKGVSNLTGTDYKRSSPTQSSGSDHSTGTPAVSGMADSLSTQSGQVSMGNSRSTKG